MHLTLHTDFSFRVLIYLYMKYPEPATVGEISEYFGVSRHHLVKVANNLGHLGLVEPLRGKGGGLRLLELATKLTAGKMLRLLEGEKPMVDCSGQRSKSACCAVLPICRFGGVLDAAMEKFYAELDRYTLADLIKEPEGLRVTPDFDLSVTN